MSTFKDCYIKRLEAEIAKLEEMEVTIDDRAYELAGKRAYELEGIRDALLEEADLLRKRRKEGQ